MERLIRFAAAFLLLTATAAAERLGPNDRPSWNPPARYDIPYEGKLIEHQLPQQAVRRYCDRLASHYGRNWKATEHQRGCSILEPGFCVVVYIDRPYGLATPAAVKRHELGHCNGWPADHPN